MAIVINFIGFSLLMDEDNAKYWIIPILCFFAVTVFVIMAADVRANTPERYIEPPVIIPKKISNQNPYVEHCDPNTEFAPVWKIIQNSTHKFNHVICQWQVR